MKEANGVTPLRAHMPTAATTCSGVIRFLIVFRISRLADSTPKLTAVQDRYVAQIVREVNEFDNVILEICDEPTLKGTPAALAVSWIDHLVDVIVKTEAGLPKQHLVAQQYMNGVDFTRDDRVPLITTQYIRQASEQIGGVEALKNG